MRFTLLLFPFCLQASLIVTGQSPLGMFADADLAIPADPANAPMAQVRITQHSSWSGDITVQSSSGGFGYLDLYVTTMATSFQGCPCGEYLDSWATITAPWYLTTPGYEPYGSTPEYAMERLPFMSGVAQHVTFDAWADSSYMYAAYLSGPLFPYMADRTIHSFVEIDLGGIDGGYSGSVVFTPDDPPLSAPEPSTWLSALSALVLIASSTVHPQRAR
ncbi:MAG TPA: hypothetical protein VKQ11_00550 [Candidatus Sulfotelmatobacter sp.]|nr:hypothetical protein [Candidatus Sulfotelmatobacter sp.]